MLVAVWRYSTALACVAGALSQPALARGHFSYEGGVRHHHHQAYMRAAAVRHFAHSRVDRRTFAMVEQPATETWSGPHPSFMSESYQYRAPARRGRRRVVAEAWQTNWQAAPQGYWQNGWRGHRQQDVWWQDNGQQRMRRQPRLQRRDNVAAFGGDATGYSATDAYQPQYSWSASGESFDGRSGLDGMVAQQASAAGVPLSLAERVVRRESGGNPRAMHAGNYGLMQIRLGTARAMGYGGSAAGLLDPAVNMTYAMRYLAGAYRAAGGNESRAVALYARGYHAARVPTYTF
jgi:soluble lytic murein transglycosylase-like protein